MAKTKKSMLKKNDEEKVTSHGKRSKPKSEKEEKKDKKRSKGAKDAKKDTNAKDVNKSNLTKQKKPETVEDKASSKKKRAATPPPPPQSNEAKKKVKAEDRKQPKKDQKDSNQETTSPPPPPKHRHTRKKPEETVESVTTPRKELFADSSSGFTSPAVSLSSIKQWKEEASQKGMSLEDYMEEVSRAALEQELDRRMTTLAEKEAEKEAQPEEENATDEAKEKGTKEKGTLENEVGEKETKETGKKKKKEAEKEEENDDDDDDGDSSSSSESSESDEGSEHEELSGDEDECDEDDEEEAESEEGKLSDLDGEEMASEEIDLLLEGVGGNLVPEEKKDAPTKQQQLVAVAANQHQAAPGPPARPPADPAAPDYSTANSVTHKPEWDKFARQCLDRKKFPASLAPHYIKDKTDLFRSWLTAKGDWDQVEIQFKRKSEKINTSRKERQGTKARDLLKIYPKAKAEQLMGSLKKRGLYYFDPDFPGDEEERWLVHAKMDECLKKSAESRKFAISLGSLEYTGDLTSQLMKFSSKMEKVFKCLQELRQNKVTDERAYQKHFNIVDEKLAWYTQAEAAASALQKGLKPKKEKAKKEKKDKKEKDTEGTGNDGDSSKKAASA